MTVAMQAAPISVEEFERLPDTDGYELIDGELVEVPNMGARAGWTAGEVGRRISNYCDEHKTGWYFSSDTEFACFPGRPKMVRKPDGSFIAHGRFERDRPPRGIVRIAPDLAVEVVSPHDLHHKIEEKLSLFLAAGTRLIWLLDPDSRTITTYNADGTARRLTADQELTGGNVLPGFNVRVGDLFLPPDDAEAAAANGHA